MLMNIGAPVEIVKASSGDDDTVKKLKSIIRKSTTLNPSGRPTSQQIYDFLLQLLAGEDIQPVPFSQQPSPQRQEPKRPVRKKDDKEGSPGLDRLLELMCQLIDVDPKDLGARGDGHDEISKGDKVKIESDVNKAIKLQEGHGGWNNAMRTALGKIGIVVDKIRHVSKVQCPDGNTWSFNPKLLAKVDEEGRVLDSNFKKYDIVEVLKDESAVRSLQKEHGGWNRKMRFALGCKAIVNKIDTDGDVLVECINNDNWTFNAEALRKLSPSTSNLERGDMVLICSDKNTVKRLQAGHGGWHPDMQKYLGTTATVQDVLKDNEVVVRKSKDDMIVYNVEALTLVAKKDELIEAIAARKHTRFEEADNTRDTDEEGFATKFSRYDLVKVIEDETMAKFLQAERGIDWERKMRSVLGLKGIVQIITEDGKVKVECINGMDFIFNPAALQKIPPGATATVGALVMIPSDFELVKALQEACDVWKGEMAECLGHSGYIKKILPNDLLQIEVNMHRGNEDPLWPFCPNAVSVVATKNEIVQAIRRKQAGDVVD